MRPCPLLLVGLVAAAPGVCWPQAPATTAAVDFEAGDLAAWQITGDVAIGADNVHGGQGCLRVGQGAEALLPVAAEDGFGTVTMWVYDSGYRREGQAEKDRVFGPMWGLSNSVGKRLVFGLVYAPYLGGNSSYGWVSTAENDWFSRRHARVGRRQGWHKWEFVYNNETDLTVRVDDREATAFDVMTARYHQGFNAICLRGSREIEEPLLVDDIQVAYQPQPLTERVRPLPGEAWKPPEMPPLPLKEELRGKHPRLFFTAEDVADIRQRCQTTHAMFFEQLMSMGNAYVNLMPPEKASDCSNDQNMQQWGWWRLATLAFTYVATGERSYAEKAREWMLIFAGYDDWGSGGEANQSMGAGNMLSGMACAYDWCYDVLSEDERRLIRDKLATQVAEMYHLGFNDPKTAGYWKGDRQNNHMHHRLCGLLLGALAIHGDVPEAEAYVSFAAQECRLVQQALPPDGSNHESPGYQAFGHSYVVRCLDALRHTTGIDLFEHPGLRNMPYFRAHMLTPGFTSVFNFGDGGSGTYYFNHYHFRLAAQYQDPVAQALMLKAYQASRGSFIYPPWPILWYDGDLAPASLEDVPTWRYFPDLEVATYRSSWTDPNALAVFFKCGPYGGHRLNELVQERGGGWFNVAHDHPDANSFMVFAKGHFWATDDGYPRRSKTTENHNAILVDGKGMAHRGGGWSQPIRGMPDMGRIRACFGSPGYFAVLGDAANYYSALTKADRWLAVLDDTYVVVTDALHSDRPRQYQWLYHCDGEWRPQGDPPRHLWITKEGVTCGVHMAWPARGRFETGPDELEGRPRGTLLTVEPAQPAAQAHFAAIICPLAEGEKWPMPRIRAAERPGLGLILELSRDPMQDVVVFNESGAELADEEMRVATDGSLAIVTSRDGRPREVFMLSGTRVSVGDRRLVEADSGVSLRWRGNAVGGTLWAAVPVGQEQRAAEVTVAGLTANRAYRVQGEEWTRDVQADAAGRLALTVDLASETRQYHVSMVP